MRISWREVLGLLIGVALCYVLFSYAVVYAPQIREAASERTQEDSRGEGTEQRTTPAASDEDTKTVTVRVTGPSGQQFGVNYGNLNASRSDEGVVPADYEVEVRTDPSSGDYVTATAWKITGNSRELKVQILDNASVVKEGSTTEDYGAAGVRWNPNEPPQPGGTTTPATQKKAVEGSGFSPQGDKAVLPR